MNPSLARPDRGSLPFLPSDLAQPEQALIRAATAHFIAFTDQATGGETAPEIARRAWPRDQATLRVLTQVVTRAAVDPTDTTAAAVLSHQSVGAFIESLRPISAAGRLISDGIRIPL